MGGAQARARARARVDALAASTLDVLAFRQQALAALSDAVQFDAHVWLLTDPVSTVGAAPHANVPCLPELASLVRFKYATPVNRWTTLMQEPVPVATLVSAVGGDLADSLVWREVLSRYEVRDVLSAVFADRFGCWGFLDLWRIGDGEPFSSNDCDLVASVAAALTSGQRASLARTFVEPATSHRTGQGPVVLTLDDELHITSRTAASQPWLDRLLPPAPDEPGVPAVPASVYNVAAQLQAAESGVDGHPPSARVHLADGFWLTLRAARLAGEGRSGSGTGESTRTASIVVTVEEASPVERLEIFARAFGLTAREDELLRLLALGDDTRAMARRLSLSEYTVQDHLRSVFAKTGAHDRISVLSRALGARLLV